MKIQEKPSYSNSTYLVIEALYHSYLRLETHVEILYFQCVETKLLFNNEGVF